MARPDRLTIDGNEATAAVAHRCSEVIAIYPITPSTGMGELSDAWSAQGRTNLWGQVPQVVELQSEGGAAGTLHGALLGGRLATTFTASQGLLLMIPNMSKIAGELTPAVIHVAARSLATHALSIFGDHSDVMAVRACGWGMLIGTSVQEAQDLAAVAHAATLATRIPFLHVLDGFRTSHEIATITPLADDHLKALLPEDAITAHRSRALSPEHPTLRGTAQNPDVFFQAREAGNPWYDRCVGQVAATLDQFAQLTGRRYGVVEYQGHPQAERVVVAMGSGVHAVAAAVTALIAKGERVGLLTVRLYRPFPAAEFLRLLPTTVRTLAVLDRTKEPGAVGEPLFTDVAATIAEDGRRVRLLGGRYGLSSKEFTPAMAQAVFREMDAPTPRRRFTVGITDDVGHLSLEVPAIASGPTGVRSCLFWGLGSDGTVGANKNSIKIITEGTGQEAQAYFVYDSKKAGSVTVSHLRFGHQPIAAPWLIDAADFIAVHAPGLLWRQDVLAPAAPGATVLLNLPHPPDRVWRALPREAQTRIRARGLRLFTIDANAVAATAGMPGRINTVMQTCFFALAGVLPRDDAIAAILHAIATTYAKRGPAVVERNQAAVRAALDHLHEVTVPVVDGAIADGLLPPVAADAPPFVHDILGEIIAGRGDALRVSQLPADGAFPTATSRYEKRALAEKIPVWEADLCLQCGKCTVVCPHGCLRSTVFDPAADSAGALASAATKAKELPGERYTIQVSPDDCTGCSLCVEACPAKDRTRVGRKALNLAPVADAAPRERERWAAFTRLPALDPARLPVINVRNSQLRQPYFEFSGACSGCGETPYVKLLTQLVGDRLVVANATGCSSIYGGNLPTTPWATDAAGRGPAWANSLFEDNAEFGLGLRLAADSQTDEARRLVAALGDRLGDLGQDLLAADQTGEAAIAAQRTRIAALRQRLAGDPDPRALRLLAAADGLLDRSVWLIGGDGWAYDIGFGGLDHVLAGGHRIKVLVLDTEVYSNTGGQASKSTPRGAVAKFAAAGKATPKKDLGLMAMSYGHVYVARVALGANDAQTVQALAEAEAYDGPALVIAYSHCIAHGIDMRSGLAQQKAAVACGHWPLYRFHPGKEQPLTIDSKEPTLPFATYAGAEGRYRILSQADPERAERLAGQARTDAAHRRSRLTGLLGTPTPTTPSAGT